MRRTYEIACKKAENAWLKGKQQYDKIEARSVALALEDRVLVKKFKERGGPGKLRSYWEDTVHIVVGRMNSNFPMYEIQSEDEKGPIHRLHRNLLLQCNDLFSTMLRKFLSQDGELVTSHRSQEQNLKTNRHWSRSRAAATSIVLNHMQRRSRQVFPEQNHLHLSQLIQIQKKWG